MDEYMKQILEIVKALASVRAMTEEEITGMVAKLAASLRGMDGGASAPEGDAETTSLVEPKKAVREKSIICMECGKSYKVITRKHLAGHGLNQDEYREKHGYPKGMPLICKHLQRERRKAMKDMRLWEKREKKAA